MKYLFLGLLLFFSFDCFADKPSNGYIKTLTRYIDEDAKIICYRNDYSPDNLSCVKVDQDTIDRIKKEIKK